MCMYVIGMVDPASCKYFKLKDFKTSKLKVLNDKRLFDTN